MHNLNICQNRVFLLYCVYLLIIYSGVNNFLQTRSIKITNPLLFRLFLSLHSHIAPIPNPPITVYIPCFITNVCYHIYRGNNPCIHVFIEISPSKFKYCIFITELYGDKFIIKTLYNNFSYFWKAHCSKK